MSDYQAIVFDLDGTAIPNSLDAMPSQTLIDTVTRYRDRIHLIAATSRTSRHALPVIRALGLTEWCVISGGSLIYDAASDRVIQNLTLERQAVAAIFGLSNDLPYQLCIRDERVAKADYLKSLADNIELIFLEQVIDEDLEIIRERVQAIPNTILTTAPSWTGIGHVAIFTHINATKEHAVKTVLRHLGIDQAHAIGVGDGDNDTHLFRAVGLKIAMGNASDQLKAASDLVTASIGDHGLAHVIERYAGQTTPPNTSS